MGNEKFMMVGRDNETGLTQLSKKGGGAALMRTNTALIIAYYVKDKVMTHNPKEFQTAGGCAEQVATMAQYLKDQGY